MTDGERTTVYAEDLVIGEPFPIGSYTFTTGDIVEFATEWDPQTMHIDPAAAEAGHHGGIIASGLHTLGVFQRLAVLSVYRDWELIAGRAIRDIRFRKPVRPGTTLTGTVTVTAVEHRDDRRSLVHKRGELRDESAEVVFSFVAEAYVARRRP